MKKILLPTDFSSNAWNAITYALGFFRDEECTFYFLHTYSPAFYRVDYLIGGPAYSAVSDAGVDFSLARLEKTMQGVNEQYQNPKHHFETLSAFNILTDEIKDVCERKNIDLILMGTQGATGAKEIFLGTNTVFVLRKAKVPVLVVPENHKFKEIKSILFPTDYRSPYKKKELQFMIDVAKMHKAKLIVMHMKEGCDLTLIQKENKEFLAEYFDVLDHAFEEIEGHLMPNAIYEYIDEHYPNLLAMMNRKHSLLERLLTKQNVDSIGFHTKIPFLVMRDTSKITKKT
ncbi:MAG: universal stress protein [Maribacter sp.]|nr:universal stress protein [Maribacter sp.]